MPIITTPGYPSINPVLIEGYLVERQSGNIVHDSIDPEQTHDYVSLAVSSRPTGTLVLLFTDQDSAKECLERHAKRLVYTVHDPGVHIFDMNYIVSGRIRIEPSDSRASWIVSVDFREVVL